MASIGALRPIGLRRRLPWALGFLQTPDKATDQAARKRKLDAAIWGLIGTIVGALSSIATTWLSMTSSSTLQEAKAKEERFERANAFQRETLLQLQESIHDALRLVHRAYIEDHESLRKGTPWSKAMLSDELSENIRLAQRKVSILIERVTDEIIRSQVKTLMKIATQAMLATSEADAREHLERSEDEASLVFESLGSALRSHY